MALTKVSTKQIENGVSAKAWVVFDASSGTPVIKNSFNVASITDNGIGDFTINFIEPMPNADYVVIGAASQPNGSTTSAAVYTRLYNDLSATQNNVRVLVGWATNGSTGTYDYGYATITIFGD